MYMYQLYFTDMLNQRSAGGQYLSFSAARATAIGIVRNGLKSSWEIVRVIDGIVLAQSK